MEPVQMDNQTKEDILRSLIERYSNSITRLAFTYVKDWSLAEDITQEVYITCYKKLDDFRGDSSYKTWLFKITVNKCKDYLKSKWFRRILPVDYMDFKGLVNNQTVIEENLIETEEIELAEKVMALPVKYREVIIFYFYEDLKLQEIADLTGTKLATIKSRLMRAKSSLRKMF
ncbi:sigma-70 family RNA polymerase sigma factor [Litchfieldia alkalitelluris]|uniref:sigma-70 family RNA polymerase sigma factor n=1 Tax=Litchfieldia alkalitelluris TaxID=304268 RepID=UPI001F47BE95|nr:sigma-70 family RNA polymerase sigma factor [Litchfieldia alkalitelluris]